MEAKSNFSDVKDAYQIWSNQYDTNDNKTRDLEGIALQNILSTINFNTVLELGCGTGKNTVWLESNSQQLTAVDFSDAMIVKATEKVNSSHVTFINADINNPWNFTNEKFDLISFSLVLEHIEDLDAIFNKAKDVTQDKGFIYIGELHPFKQYDGSKARYSTEFGEQILTCFTHHVSDFIQSALRNGFELYLLEEWFDNNDKTQIPRILSLLFQKK